jgi:putative membrane protein
MNSNAGNTSRGARGQAGGDATLGSNDRKFVTEAAMSGMAEVELGRLAVARGAGDAVKQFGQRMVDDHTRANEELMQLASGLGVVPPAQLDAKHQAVVAKLSRLSGAEFDRAYAKQMVTDHQKAVSLFQREADRGAHADLKAFAGGKLPALQEHLRMARELAGARQGGGNTNSTH